MTKLYLRIFLVLLLGGTGLAFYPSQPVVVAPGAIGPYLNGVFTPRAPGNGLNFTLEDPLPGQTFYGPVRLIPFAGTEDLLLLGKRGEVWRINMDDQAAETVLDFKDRTFSKGDASATGIALHPRFAEPDASPEERVIFIYYRTKPEPDVWDEKGFNRLSKFTWDEDTQAFDADSEEILIQQYDRSTWHNGGDLFFGPDGFLYISTGDEGQEQFIEFSNQRIDAGFFGGLLRIDIDNDPTRSHPIIKQPRGLETPPEGWGETFSQGYSIPNDNPWLSPEGDHLEEFYAIGLRSPYVSSYDTVTGKILIADVGDGDMEEISVVERGDNLQWPLVEGTLERPELPRPDEIIGNQKPPYLAYSREFGSSITGGDVYWGGKFADLNGHYIFSDFISNRLMAVDATAPANSQNNDLIVLINDLRNEHPDIPQGAGATGIFHHPNGDIYLLILGSRMESIPGKIFRLRQIGAVPEPAERLSELGAFTDLATLTPADGILPYRTNSPLWSDRAVKQRWLALPNDGTFDQREEQIDFSPTGDWTFPEGSVLIKHFELPLTTDPDGPTRRLETRFFIVGPEGSYGLSYHWNEAGTEAFLGNSRRMLDIDITDATTGDYAYTQTWEFPSRGQCLTCHTAAAGYTLGLSTHQMNGELQYPEIGNTPINQLTYLEELGAFRQGDIPAVEQLPKAFSIDDESVGLDIRVRSYLDANCSSCHRPGGSNLGMDLRFHTPLPFTNIINVEAVSNNSEPGRLLVKPGSHQDSELWHRDASLAGNKMPPLSKNMVDEPYLLVLAEWIDGLRDEDGINTEDIFYPNPMGNLLSIRLRDDWSGPFTLELFAANGQRIHRGTFNRTNHQLETGFLAPGVYLIRVSAGGEVVSRKIVKQ